MDKTTKTFSKQQKLGQNKSVTFRQTTKYENKYSIYIRCVYEVIVYLISQIYYTNF